MTSTRSAIINLAFVNYWNNQNCRKGKKYREGEREREREIQKPNVGKLKACLPDN